MELTAKTVIKKMKSKELKTIVFSKENPFVWNDYSCSDRLGVIKIIDNILFVTFITDETYIDMWQASEFPIKLRKRIYKFILEYLEGI